MSDRLEARPRALRRSSDGKNWALGSVGEFGTMDSSLVLGAAYDPETSVLDLLLSNGSVWRYALVQSSLVSGLVAAPSKGEFYNRRIRGKFPSMQLQGGVDAGS